MLNTEFDLELQHQHQMQCRSTGQNETAPDTKVFLAPCLAQIDHIMLDSGIQVHMATQLIQGLPGLGGCMRVKAPVRALLHQPQAPGRGQPEQAAALSGVPGRHDDRHGFVQHCLRGTTLSGLLPCLSTTECVNALSQLRQEAFHHKCSASSLPVSHQGGTSALSGTQTMSLQALPAVYILRWKMGQETRVHFRCRPGSRTGCARQQRIGSRSGSGGCGSTPADTGSSCLARQRSPPHSAPAATNYASLPCKNTA